MELNTIGIAGTVAAAPERHRNIYGQQDIYALWLDITRDSGIVDRVLVLFQAKKINGEGRVELIKEGSRLEVTGQLQTYKDWNAGRYQLFVWGTYLAALPEGTQELNSVYLTAEVLREPIYRETPKSRRITDMALRVPSAFSPGYTCVIPCITWGSNAAAAAEVKPGDTVYLEGRLQSREYEKDGQVFTTWEVSASKMDTKENYKNGN